MRCPNRQRSDPIVKQLDSLCDPNFIGCRFDALRRFIFFLCENYTRASLEALLPSLNWNALFMLGKASDNMTHDDAADIFRDNMDGIISDLQKLKNTLLKNCSTSPNIQLVTIEKVSCYYIVNYSLEISLVAIEQLSVVSTKTETERLAILNHLTSIGEAMCHIHKAMKFLPESFLQLQTCRNLVLHPGDYAYGDILSIVREENLNLMEGVLKDLLQLESTFGHMLKSWPSKYHSKPCEHKAWLQQYGSQKLGNLENLIRHIDRFPSSLQQKHLISQYRIFMSSLGYDFKKAIRNGKTLKELDGELKALGFSSKDLLGQSNSILVWNDKVDDQIIQMNTSFMQRVTTSSISSLKAFFHGLSEPFKLLKMSCLTFLDEQYPMTDRGKLFEIVTDKINNLHKSGSMILPALKNSMIYTLFQWISYLFPSLSPMEILKLDAIQKSATEYLVKLSGDILRHFKDSPTKGQLADSSAKASLLSLRSIRNDLAHLAHQYTPKSCVNSTSAIIECMNKLIQHKTHLFPLNPNLEPK